MSSPLPSSDEQAIPAPVEGGETVATGEGREGTSRSGGGKEDASKNDNDDLDVTWVGSSGATDDIDAAVGETPKTKSRTGDRLGGAGVMPLPTPATATATATPVAAAVTAVAVRLVMEAAVPLMTVPLNCPRETRTGCRAGTTR